MDEFCHVYIKNKINFQVTVEHVTNDLSHAL